MSEMRPLAGEDVHGATATSVTTVWLPPELTAPTTARHAAREVAAQVREEVVAAIELVVSELVTNAVKHAGLQPTDRIQLVAERSKDQIRIEVWDAGSGFEAPKPEPVSLMRPSGWGLYLVDSLADRWGTTRDAGMRVWSEFDL
jgi:serine/threonine-protein kinase RsbW